VLAAIRKLDLVRATRPDGLAVDLDGETAIQNVGVQVTVEFVQPIRATGSRRTERKNRCKGKGNKKCGSPEPHRSTLVAGPAPPRGRHDGREFRESLTQALG
jgi:hypothetical protein